MNIEELKRQLTKNQNDLKELQEQVEVIRTQIELVQSETDTSISEILRLVDEHENHINKLVNDSERWNEHIEFVDKFKGFFHKYIFAEIGPHLKMVIRVVVLVGIGALLSILLKQCEHTQHIDIFNLLG